MTPTEIYNAIKHIAGDNIFSFGNIEVVCKLSRELPKNPTIIEIGTLYGRSAFSWALSRPDVKVYTIDKEDRINTINNQIKFLGLEGRVIPKVGLSVEFLWNEKVNLVFIDGGHEYNEVTADLNKWDKFAKNIICGHDYIPQFMGVIKAVDHFYKDRVRPFKNFWVVRK